MPRPKGTIKSKLPENEVAICLRVREVRVGLGLSQEEFARQLDITRSSLASYEDARAPIKVGVGLKICHQFIVSEQWLAIGRGYLGSRRSESVPFSHPLSRVYMDLIKEPEVKNLNQNRLFSAAFDEVFANKYASLLADGFIHGRFEVSVSDDVGRLKNVLDKIVSASLGVAGCDREKRLVFDLVRSGCLLVRELETIDSPDDSPTFFEQVLSRLESDPDADWNIIEGSAASIISQAANHLNPETEKKDFPSEPFTQKWKDNLDKVFNPPTVASVIVETPSWPELKREIVRLTSRRGEQTALANHLGVSRQVVGNWLTSDDQGAPSAKLTLELLKWVYHKGKQETKTKALAVRSTPPEPKTRMKGIREDNKHPSR